MSTPPVVEFVWYKASDEAKLTPTLGKEALDIVSSTPGAQKVFRGYQAEDDGITYVSVAWDSIKAHQDLMQDKARYDPVGASLGPTVAPGAQLSMVHAAFNNHEAAVQAIEDPATELAFLTLKSADKASILRSSLDNLEKALATSPGRRSYTWGKVVEKEDQYLLIIGWDSVEAHWDALKVDQNLSAAVAKMRESVDIDLVHVHYKGF
ncbi:hypothetical protein OE88DRAFT_1725182 [Heliocybe sulcata]|uniref:ABM domain-containing protein n=1 Tax=Heliocybe sulcata TaxID=5364 RepID=A0A5C3N483_9AGAM|nr:hypothetical protein OE88DRAFT_1725182 [Heliocybe sulcata]